MAANEQRAQPLVTRRFATQDFYDFATGGATYEGNDTKVNPSAELLDYGWAPEKRPGAQSFGYLLNAVNQWITALVAGWLKNYPKPTSLESGAPGIMAANCMAFGPACTNGAGTVAGRWFVAGSDPTVTGVMSSADGVSWKTETTVSSGAVSVITDIACHPSSDQVMGISETLGALRIYRRNTSQVWSDAAAPVTSDRLKIVRINENFGLFLIGGRKSADTKAAIYTAPDAVTWTERTLSGAAAATILTYMEGTAGKMVAIDDGAAGAAKSWTSTNGTSWTQNAGFAPSGTIRGLAYDAVDPEGARWYLFTSTNVYKSDDGTTWDSLTALAGDFASGRPSAFKSHNGVLCAPSDKTGCVKYSTDRGVTWYDFQPPQTTTTIAAIRAIVYGGGRWGVAVDKGSNKSDVAITPYLAL